jgi:hypothetical protein
VEAYVEHRHLLPDEFDLLVDGEEGFGVAPLLGHIESCAECRAQLESRRRVAHELERLQHLTPSPLFAYRVMQRVQVYEPWYVPALDSARRFVPRSRPARLFAGATAGFAALTMTVAAVWIVSRLDVAFFLLSIVSERARHAVVGPGRGTPADHASARLGRHRRSVVGVLPGGPRRGVFTPRGDRGGPTAEVVTCPRRYLASPSRRW